MIDQVVLQRKQQKVAGEWVDCPVMLVGVIVTVNEIRELHHIGFEISGTLDDKDMTFSVDIPRDIVHYYPSMVQRLELAEIVRETSEFEILEICPKQIVVLPGYDRGRGLQTRPSV